MEEKDVRLSRSRMFSWVSGRTWLGSNERDVARGTARRFAGGSCDVLNAQLSERARFLRMNGSTYVVTCKEKCSNNGGNTRINRKGVAHDVECSCTQAVATHASVPKLGNLVDSVTTLTLIS